MGLIWELIKAMNENKEKRNEEKLEREMDLYHLEDVEREYVKRGDYEPYNFEDSKDEKIDEDDYYFDN